MSVAVALEADVPASGDWTTDDLDALPEDGRRRELIDGVLIVSPSPTNYHQSLAARLCVRLDESCPDYLEATQAVEVRINRRRAFIPDVLVTTAEAAARNGHWFAPHEVILAVEIVSPSTRTFDRVTKPALYAQAGIPYYWRVETLDALEIHTYRLDPVTEVYWEAGIFTDVVELAEPWAIQLPLRDINPRRGA